MPTPGNFYQNHSISIDSYYPTHSKFSYELMACDYLWAEVLKQAIEDLDLPRTHPNSSLGWFLSTSIEICSFHWVCHVLGISHFKVLVLLAGKIRSALEAPCLVKQKYI